MGQPPTPCAFRQGLPCPPGEFLQSLINLLANNHAWVQAGLLLWLPIPELKPPLACTEIGNGPKTNWVGGLSALRPSPQPHLSPAVQEPQSQRQPLSQLPGSIRDAEHRLSVPAAHGGTAASQSLRRGGSRAVAFPHARRFPCARQFPRCPWGSLSGILFFFPPYSFFFFFFRLFLPLENLMTLPCRPAATKAQRIVLRKKACVVRGGGGERCF